MDLDSGPVSLVDEECKRIPSGVLAESPGEVLGPWLIDGPVICVPPRADLEKDRVEVV